MNISEAAFELMDELFFMISFEELEKESEFQKNELINLLNELLNAGWVDQLYIPKGKLDYEKRATPDHQGIVNYSYLATKKGLLGYNGIEKK